MHRKFQLIVEFFVRFVTSALLFLYSAMRSTEKNSTQYSDLKVWDGELEYGQIHGIGVSTATKQEFCSLFLLICRGLVRVESAFQLLMRREATSSKQHCTYWKEDFVML